MIEITDELLNRYIDGELSSLEVKEVDEVILKSTEARKKLRALQLVHNELMKMPERETSS